MRAMQWVHVFVDVPPASQQAAAAFWSHALGLEVGHAWPGHDEFRSLERAGEASYVHLQTGDHGPRIHLDVEVDDVATEIERLGGLGADVGEPGDGWHTMSSPGGLPFCLIPCVPHAATPAATRWGDGHRSRLVQVCIDSPPPLHDVEVAFWQAATGWRWSPSDAAEFAGTLHAPAGSAIARLLFQRLDTADPDEATDAHIDLGTDDVDAEVARLRVLGADVSWHGRPWVAMTDPTGMAFCVTPNPPD